MRKLGAILWAMGMLAISTAGVSAQTTLFFDGSGAENGVTERGTRSFSFMGSNWSGGVVETEGILALYASGSFSYEIEAGGGSVTFDPPVGSVRFFYVHGFGFAPGVASAFDASDISVGMADSRQATFFGDSHNSVSIESGDPDRAHRLLFRRHRQFHFQPRTGRTLGDATADRHADSS